MLPKHRSTLAWLALVAVTGAAVTLWLVWTPRDAVPISQNAAVDRPRAVAQEFTLASGARHANPVSDDRVSERLDRLEKQLGSLAETLDRLVDQAAGSQGFSNDHAQGIDPARSEDVNRTTDADEAAKDRAARVREAYDATLAAEAPDDDWAEATAFGIEEAFSSLYPPSSAQIVTSDCRATLCRVEALLPADTDDWESAPEFLQLELFSRLSEQIEGGVVQYVPDASGQQRLIGYLLRKGHQPAAGD